MKPVACLIARLKLSAWGVAVRVSTTVLDIIKSKSIYYRYYFD